MNYNIYLLYTSSFTVINNMHFWGDVALRSQNCYFSRVLMEMPYFKPFYLQATNLLHQLFYLQRQYFEKNYTSIKCSNKINILAVNSKMKRMKPMLAFFTKALYWINLYSGGLLSLGKNKRLRKTGSRFLKITNLSGFFFKIRLQ